MVKIPQEKLIEKYDALPESWRLAMNSEEYGKLLWAIGESNHLPEEKIEKIIPVIGYIILGFIHTEDLAKELVAETGVDKRVAEEVAREIRLKILDPIIKGAPSAEAGAAPIPATAAPVPAAPFPREEVLKPTFAPPVQEAGSRKQEAGEEGQPFILHEEKEIESVARTSGDLVRPAFYQEAGSRKQEAGIERPVSARLEIGPSTDSTGSPQAGRGQGERKEPRVGRTGEPTVRVVHYAGPKTPVDPFSPGARGKGQGTELGKPEPEPPSEVHPENIINLKDLPK